MKTVITCAVTGGTAVPRNHPNFPITPKQIAEQALDAGRAGAAIVHIHVRKPDTGEPSGELAYYRETVDRISVVPRSSLKSRSLTPETSAGPHGCSNPARWKGRGFIRSS